LENTKEDLLKRYYNWMQNGDFPLYTKRCLEKIWRRWNAKKEAQRSEKQNTPKPEQAQQSQARKVEEAKPIDTDMLQQLKMKFGK
jgi:DNA polymerase-3 subunit epsilon